MVDVAGDHVDVAPDGHDLERRPGAASPGRDDLDRLAAAGPLAQEHLVAGEEGDGDAALRAGPGQPGPGPLGGGRAGGRPGAAASSMHRGDQDGELTGTWLGGHGCLLRPTFVPSERFAPNAPSVQGAENSAPIL